MMNTYDWFIARCKAVINHSRPPEPPMRVRLHEAGHAVVGWDDASLNGRPVTVVYYETRDGGGNVRTYPGDSRRLAYAAARPRALMIGARLHGGNAYVEP